MTILIYSTTTCPFCKMEKAYLDSKGIKYQNKFVDQDQSAAEEMINESGQMGVPFMVISRDDNSKVEILGFDKSKIDIALNLM